MANEKPTEQKNYNPLKAPDVELYFDVRDSGYWYRVNGRYVCLKKADLTLHLRTLGLSDGREVPTGKGSLHEIDHTFWKAQTQKMIDYAGSLAGHRTGIFTDGSKRKFLVTDEANGVWEDTPKKVIEPKFFVSFIQELLPGDQWFYFSFWLSIALRSLRRGDFRPGQAIVLAGPAGCGKSLLQSIITEVLGGRASNPFRYMMGLTQFNKDLACAEHWQIEDPATTIDIRARRQFGAMLKEVTVNRDFSIHQKGKDALSLPVLRRVSISVNNEPENLAVVPPLDLSIIDKVFLFLCLRVVDAFAPFRVINGTTPLPGMSEVRHDGELDRKEIWEAVKSEVPQIRAWLLNKFKTVPEGQRDDRFGIRAWHHPDLLEDLNAMDPETKLLWMIDEVFFLCEKPYESYIGRANEIEEKLSAAQPIKSAQLMKGFGSCGSFLGRIAKKYPHRVEKGKKLDGNLRWTIKPPSKKEANEQGNTNGQPHA